MSILSTMARRHSRSAVLGAPLALLAVFGLIGLSGWHDAVVHDEDPVHVVSVVHNHAGSKSDPDAPIHLLAHSIGQWVDYGGAIPTPHLIPIADRRWAIANYDLPGGLDPAALLRPPRR